MSLSAEQRAYLASLAQRADFVLATGLKLEVTVRLSSGGMVLERAQDVHTCLADVDMAASILARLAACEAALALQLVLIKQEPLLPGHC